MKAITLEQLLLFHKKIIEATGGSPEIRDQGLIVGALERAKSTFDNKDLYNSIEEKVSVITYSLIKNHGFVDGNKRIGIATMLLLLELNHVKVNYSQDELVKLGLGIASGEINEQGIKSWISKHRI